MIFDSTIIAAFHLVAEFISDTLGALSTYNFINTLQVLSVYVFDILAYIYFFLPVTYLVPLFTVVFGWLSCKIAISFISFVCNILSVIFSFF